MLRLDVTDLFGLELDVVVGAALVDDLDVAHFVPHDLVLDRRLVAMLRLVFDLLVDEGVLGEHFAHQKLFGQREGLHVLLRDVNELGLGVGAEIVVAEKGVRADLMRDFKRLLVKWLLVRVIANANEPIQDEVHLKDFLLLVIDDIFFLFFAEVTRFQAEGDIVEELAILVCLRVEEKAEVVKDVIEQIMHNNSPLDLPRQSIDKLIVLLDLAEPVILPKVLEVLIDLPIEAVGQRFVPEPRQQGHPIVQIESLLLVTQVLIEGRDDLDEGAHDVGEEGHARQHDKNAEDHFMAGFGRQIAVSHG